MKRFLRGFGYAARGVWFCVRNERNFRFHLVAAAYVLALAPSFALSRGQWAALCLTIALVLAAEAVNTAIEQVVDYLSPQRHPAAGAAKDVAAGAVLLCALGAVCVAVPLFWQPQQWAALLVDWQQQWWKPLLLAASALPSVWFVFGWSHKPS